MSKIRKIRAKLIICLKAGLILSGGLLLLFLILALTSLPFWARYRLAQAEAGVPQNTKSILVMGGGGFPSEAVLMRLWYTAELANQNPEAKVIVATPGDFRDSTSTVYQMHCYLCKQGIDTMRLLVEPEGLNTRHQALKAYDMMVSDKFEEPLVVVTSPAHLYRSVKSFKRAGFSQVGGVPTMEVMLETDLKTKSKELGGNTYVPDVSRSISLRYKFWDYLHYEIEVAREYIAITYYKLKGWI